MKEQVTTIRLRDATSANLLAAHVDALGASLWPTGSDLLVHLITHLLRDYVGHTPRFVPRCARRRCGLLRFRCCLHLIPVAFLRARTRARERLERLSRDLERQFPAQHALLRFARDCTLTVDSRAHPTKHLIAKMRASRAHSQPEYFAARQAITMSMFGMEVRKAGVMVGLPPDAPLLDQLELMHRLGRTLTPTTACPDTTSCVPRLNSLAASMPDTEDKTFASIMLRAGVSGQQSAADAASPPPTEAGHMSAANVEMGASVEAKARYSPESEARTGSVQFSRQHTHPGDAGWADLSEAEDLFPIAGQRRELADDVPVDAYPTVPEAKARGSSGRPPTTAPASRQRPLQKLSSGMDSSLTSILLVSGAVVVLGGLSALVVLRKPAQLPPTPLAKTQESRKSGKAAGSKPTSSKSKSKHAGKQAKSAGAGMESEDDAGEPSPPRELSAGSSRSGRRRRRRRRDSTTSNRSTSTAGSLGGATGLGSASVGSSDAAGAFSSRGGVPVADDVASCSVQEERARPAASGAAGSEAPLESALTTPLEPEPSEGEWTTAEQAGKHRTPAEVGDEKAPSFAPEESALECEGGSSAQDVDEAGGAAESKPGVRTWVTEQTTAVRPEGPGSGSPQPPSPSPVSGSDGHSSPLQASGEGTHLTHSASAPEQAGGQSGSLPPVPELHVAAPEPTSGSPESAESLSQHVAAPADVNNRLEPVKATLAVSPGREPDLATSRTSAVSQVDAAPPGAVTSPLAAMLADAAKRRAARTSAEHAPPSGTAGDTEPTVQPATEGAITRPRVGSGLLPDPPRSQALPQLPAEAEDTARPKPQEEAAQGPTPLLQPSASLMLYSGCIYALQYGEQGYGYYNLGPADNPVLARALWNQQQQQQQMHVSADSSAQDYPVTSSSSIPESSGFSPPSISATPTLTAGSHSMAAHSSASGLSALHEPRQTTPLRGQQFPRSALSPNGPINIPLPGGRHTLNIGASPVPGRGEEGDEAATALVAAAAAAAAAQAGDSRSIQEAAQATARMLQPSPTNNSGGAQWTELPQSSRRASAVTAQSSSSSDIDERRRSTSSMSSEMSRRSSAGSRGAVSARRLTRKGFGLLPAPSLDEAGPLMPLPPPHAGLLPVVPTQSQGWGSEGMGAHGHYSLESPMGSAGRGRGGGFQDGRGRRRGRGRGRGRGRRQ